MIDSELLAAELYHDNTFHQAVRHTTKATLTALIEQHLEHTEEGDDADWQIAQRAQAFLDALSAVIEEAITPEEVASMGATYRTRFDRLMSERIDKITELLDAYRASRKGAAPEAAEEA
jgi:hypothetical protein